MKKLLVLFTAIALVAFTIPALAADWNFYGSARMNTTYVSDNYKDNTAEYASNGSVTGDDKDSGTNWRLQSNTRFGARVKGEGPLSGRMEFGVNESTVTSRLLFGEWNFGAGKLKVGKDYTPGASQFISSSIFTGRVGTSTGDADDRNILGYGALYGGRVGQVALSFGGFNIALLDKSTSQLSGTDGDVDSYIPKIQADWGMAVDNFTFNIGGGYQTYKEEDNTNAAGGLDDLTINSYFLSGMGTAAFGPFTLKAALSYGQNEGNAGWTGGVGVFDGNDDVDDTNTFQAALVGVFKMSDMWQFEGGFGYRQDKYDANYDEDKPKIWQGYLQALVWLAPGVALMPEVGYIDWGDSTGTAAPGSSQDRGNTLYVGAKWQIDF